MASGGIFKYTTYDREVPDTFNMCLDYPEKLSVLVVSTLANDYVTEPAIHGDAGTLIRNDRPYNETERCAKSNLTAIMGRMACESGQLITWDEALNSNLELAPGLATLTPESKAPVLPDASGRYPIAKPGLTKSRRCCEDQGRDWKPREWLNPPGTLSRGVLRELLDRHLQRAQRPRHQRGQRDQLAAADADGARHLCRDLRSEGLRLQRGRAHLGAEGRPHVYTNRTPRALQRGRAHLSAKGLPGL